MRFILFFLVITTSNLFSQNENVDLPFEVKIAFEKNFPNASDPQWEMLYRGALDQQMRYEATFLQNNVKYKASFNKVGILEAVLQSIPQSELPKSIVKFLEDKYPTFKITDTAVLITPNSKKTYEVGLVYDSKFYVTVFDDTGYMLYMKER